jgi:hypothetical protein
MAFFPSHLNFLVAFFPLQFSGWVEPIVKKKEAKQEIVNLNVCVWVIILFYKRGRKLTRGGWAFFFFSTGSICAKKRE